MAPNIMRIALNTIAHRVWNTTAPPTPAKPAITRSDETVYRAEDFPSIFLLSCRTEIEEGIAGFIYKMKITPCQ